MQASDILAQTGGIQAMARQLGISEAQAASGAAALVPAILGGFKKQAVSQPAGAAGLGGLLEKLGGGGLIDNVVGPQPTDAGLGDNVLGQIFGSKDVSRTVAENASARSGLDPALLRKMLPIVAMLIAGYMAKHNGGAAGPGSGGGGLGGMLGGLLGGAGAGGLASMLDLDGDGNPLDDILNMAGKAVR